MEEFLDERITLLDENDKEIEFELVMTIEADDQVYAIMIPLEELENDKDEAYIFRLDKDEKDEIVVIPVENDEEYDIVNEVYQALVANK